LFTAYADRLRPDVSISCFIDHDLPALAAGLPFPTPLAGLIFKPVFHLPLLLGGAYQPTASEKQDALQQNMILRQALRHPALRRLYSVNAEAVPFQHLLGTDILRALPEPLPPFSTDSAAAAAIRAQLDLAPGRRIVLAAGHWSARKGLDAVVRVIQHFPPQRYQHTSVIVAGPIMPTYLEQFNGLVAELEALPGLQVVRLPGFVPDDVFLRLFELAHVVVVLYRGHVSTSNIAMHAAAARRPLLATEDGWVGRKVRAYGLGRTIDVDDVAAGAAQLAVMLDDPQAFIALPEQYAALEAAHDRTAFGRLMFEDLRALAEKD
jgi:glycosyltransferase involved in cell wall biosynthesis